MSARRSLLLATPLLSFVLVAACAGPEASRVRGGGQGADPNNRTEVVQMHEGSKPYHGTPRLIEPYGQQELAPARQAHQLSLRERAGNR